MLDISEFDTFQVGLFLWPARSLFGPSEAAAHWTRIAMGQAGQRAGDYYLASAGSEI